MMKRIEGTTIVALLLCCLVVVGNGCILEDVVTQLVTVGEACVTYEQFETSAQWTKPLVLANYGKELRNALDKAGFDSSEDSLVVVTLTAAHYTITQVTSNQHDWTIGGRITVARDGGSAATLVDYDDVSLLGELGQKTAASLGPGGVAIINAALEVFVANLDGDPANDPVLTLTVENGSVIPEPRLDDPLDFDWEACITIQMVIQTEIENIPDPWP